MSNHRLHVAYTDNTPSQPPQNSFGKRSQKEEIQATMERLWLQNPEQFNPLRDSMGRQRVEDMLSAIQSMTSLSQKHVADLGCGSGVISRIVRDAGAYVDALDVATQALDQLKSQDMHNITAKTGCLPTTTLNDRSYDIVLCTELIAYLKPTDYRMLMAELARLVKEGGFVVCSTTLDINTDNALERFAALAETEFNIEKWTLSYHLLQLRLCHFFEMPAYYLQGIQNPEHRQKELNQRKKIRRLWYSCATHPLLAIFWKTLNILFRPISSFFRQNTTMMKCLERITRFFWSDSGISQALWVGTVRPLTFPVQADHLPREVKHKRQVWE